jgi:hypothetical protein
MIKLTRIKPGTCGFYLFFRLAYAGNNRQATFIPRLAASRSRLHLMAVDCTGIGGFDDQ